jgi:ribosome-binding factor A
MARRAIHASPSHRLERVGEAVRHALADVLTRGEVADPELARRPATITAVKMTPDLKVARVMIVPLGGKHGKETVAALEAQRKAIRVLVSQRVNLKFAPDLKFVLDEGFAARLHIDTLLRSPAVARDLTAKDEADEP